MRLRELSQRVWRVGYLPQPWEWADWRWAGARGRFTGRWDALEGGLYRTVYAGETLRACLIELLAPLRPDPELVSAMEEVEEDERDAAEHPTAPAGAVDIDEWVSLRCATSADLEGRFCMVTASETIAALRPHFIAQAREVHSLKDFDAAALKDARPRELTQAVSQHLWELKDSTGDDVCHGVEFLSRHGDDLVLWAVFERPGDGQISPLIRNIEYVTMTRDTPELAEVFEFLGLQMLPQQR